MLLCRIEGGLEPYQPNSAPSREKRKPLHKGVKGGGDFRAGWAMGESEEAVWEDGVDAFYNSMS
jgi:hypothetical protein